VVCKRYTYTLCDISKLQLLPPVVGTDTLYAIAKDAQDSSLAHATSNWITIAVKIGGPYVMATAPGAGSPTPSSSLPVPEFPSWMVLCGFLTAAAILIGLGFEKRKTTNIPSAR
jgi:hypothetical protein